jgi:hypothetical protein
MDGYSDPTAVWTAPGGMVKIDPNDETFSREALSVEQNEDASDSSLPAIYLFSNSPDGDGPAYSMAEDGTVLGSHFCSHWGFMRYDLHDRGDRKADCEAHYPGGYRLVVPTEPGSLPPPEVIERNRLQGEAETNDSQSSTPTEKGE